MITRSRLIRRVSLAEAVYQAIVEAIFAGTISGGTVLTTVGVANEFGVSRTPVQEALRRLAQDGLVRLMPNRSALVIKFNEADIREVYEMRALLEPAAAARAATRLTPEELAALQKSATELKGSIETPGWAEQALRFDQEFHQQIAAACGNGRLRMEISKYRQLVRALCRMSGTRENLTAALDEHLVILDALVAHDSAAARRAMENHILARLECVLKAHRPHE